MKKILITANSFWNIVNFRQGIIRYLVDSGYDVVVVTPKPYEPKLNVKVNYIEVNMNSRGVNVLSDLSTLFRYIKILFMERPDLILTYTIKPTLYCSIAAKIFKIPIINNITGLGSSFIDNNWLTNIIIFMYRFSLAKSHLIFFQNKDDCALFREKRILNNQRFDVIPGSGINMNFFKVDRGIQIKNKDDFIFLMVSRVMRDKGVVEFINAAKMIKKSRPNIKFKILGEIDLSTNSGISASEINLWKSESDVEFLGKVENVKDYISRSTCIVLPSYREGLPRALLEASALEKPIVATDVPGCRDVVDDGMNGLFQPFPKGWI